MSTSGTASRQIKRSGKEASPLRQRQRRAPKNPTGRPTLAELERRKAKVMQVAANLFIKQGYAATSLVDIAKGAGVATRTVYQHFGDKEAIFKSVMFSRDTAAVYPPPAPNENDDVFDVMQQTADYIFSVTYRPMTLDLMRLAIAESRRFPDLTKKVVDASYNRFRRNIKGIFDYLRDEGMIEDSDTAASAEMFIHLLLGDTPQLVHAGWESPLSNNPLVRVKIDLFVAGRWGLTPTKRKTTGQKKR